MFKKSYIKKCDALLIKPLTQDELVELCKELPKYRKKSYIQMLSHFRISLSRMCCNSFLETQSMNDLWIMFYMKEKEGKMWNEGQHKWMD